MQTIGMAEARANFGRLLARVSEGGEEILLARRGKPLAALVPVDRLETRGDVGGQALQESEERFRAVFELGLVGIATLTPAGYFQQVNRAYCELVGYSEDELIGKHFSLVIHPNDLEAVGKRLRQLLAGEVEAYHHDRRYRHKEGHEVWATAGLFALRNPDGSFRSFVVQVQDITERKQAELSLRESEERYREIFEESPVAIWKEDWSSIKQMLDQLAEGGVRDWRGYLNDRRDQLKAAYDLAKNVEISRATIEIYRADSKEELVRKTTSAFTIDEELDAFRDIVLSFLAGRMTVDIESKDVAGDESEIIVRRRLVIPPKYRDDWSRVIFAIEDITERARVEEQLRQAQKMEAVGQLTGGIAHDFNNLLAVILGNAERLGEKLGGDHGDLLQTIARAGEKGAELAQRLLAFSRKQALRPRTIDLEELIGGMYALLSTSLGKRIEVETKSESGLWSITADPSQVESALLNLAINARDAMPDGGKLTIECANAELDRAYVAQNPEAKLGDFVALAISDTGVGMSEEVRERAFEPFFTTKQVGEGSGLGLSMIYGFTKQSGGHVKLESEEGEGTTVRLYLPRAELPAERTETRDVDQAPRGRGEVVLVVEDDADVREHVVRVLASLGYRVIDAPDARTALAVLSAERRVDLLLSDVVLPAGMSGWELARQTRERRGDLKILLLSAYAAGATSQSGATGLGEVLLNKPFKRRELAERVRAALDG